MWEDSWDAQRGGRSACEKAEDGQWGTQRGDKAKGDLELGVSHSLVAG